MNPYVVIGIMIAVDLITLPFIIRKMLKKEGRHKGLKITILIVAFIAIEAVCSFFYIDSNLFYDREGNQYTSTESVVYYDRDGKEYLLCETALGSKQFMTRDGKITRIADRTYVDKDGYLVFDLQNNFVKTDEEDVYTDADLNEYIKAEKAEWNRKGEISY